MDRGVSASLGLSDFPSVTLLPLQMAYALLEVRSSVSLLLSKREGWLFCLLVWLMTLEAWVLASVF